MNQHEQIAKVLDSCRPLVQSHGGELQFVRLENNVVYISLTGACTTCPFSSMTVTFGIERLLKENIPSIERVELV